MATSDPPTPLRRELSNSSVLSRLQQTMALQNWSLILTALSTFASIIYFYHALSLARNSSEASIFNTVHSEYSAPHMLESFAELENFAEATLDGNDYQAQFAKEVEARSEYGRELQHARRHIQAWYSKVAYFHSFGLLRDHFLRAFPGPDRTRHFLRLVEPLATVVARRQGTPLPSVFAHFREFYGIEGDAMAVDLNRDEL